jgi:hypothetical protein
VLINRTFYSAITNQTQDVLNVSPSTATSVNVKDLLLLNEDTELFSKEAENFSLALLATAAEGANLVDHRPSSTLVSESFNVLPVRSLHSSHLKSDPTNKQTPFYFDTQQSTFIEDLALAPGVL